MIAAVMAMPAVAVGDTGRSEGRPDGRVVVAPSAAPWQSIGRLNVGGYRIRRHCTATLIAPDHVLTARHCLVGFLGQSWVDPAAVHFLAGYTRGRYLEHRSALRFDLVGADAALITLDATATLAPVALAGKPPPGLGPGPGTRLFQAGYSADRGHVLTVDPACRILAIEPDGRWTHDCEAIGGDSGAPILIDTDRGLAIAAIHVGRRGAIGIAEPLSHGRIESALSARPAPPGGSPGG